MNETFFDVYVTQRNQGAVVIRNATAEIEGPPQGGAIVRVSGGEVVGPLVIDEVYDINGNNQRGNNLADAVVYKGDHFEIRRR